MSNANAKPASYALFDGFLPDGDAQAMRRCAEEFGRFHMYIEGPVESGFGAGLVRRHDAAMNHLKNLRSPSEMASLMARLNLFRGTYALHDDLRHKRSEPMLRSPDFAAAAAEMTGRPLVRPSMLYANLLLPGQELAVHTDTPEYRGIDKWNMPEWFLVVMLHSGLFEAWRKHVTAGVAFFGDCEGGDFLFYPEGPSAAAMRVPVVYNTAIHLDVDGLFHGVERVGSPDAPPPPLEVGMTLQYAGDARWQLKREDEVVTEYGWEQLRYSVQWKANCYADAEEERIANNHEDDLDADTVIARLVDDLRSRGRIQAERPGDTELALMMMDEYIDFPTPAQAVA